MRFHTDELQPRLTEVDCIRILEVRGVDGEREATMTMAVAAEAIQAICIALSEELDRHAQSRNENVADVLTLRSYAALVELFQPLAAAEGHAVVSLSQAELQICLLELTSYIERFDHERYQEPDLRARLQIVRRITPVLWEANAACTS